MYSASAASIQHLRTQQEFEGLFVDGQPEIVLRRDGTFHATQFPIQDRLGAYRFLGGEGIWRLDFWGRKPKLYLQFPGNHVPGNYGAVLSFAKKRRSVVIYVYLGDPDSGNRLDLEAEIQC